MDFALTDEQAALRTSIGAVVARQDAEHAGREAFGYDTALEAAVDRLGLLDGEFAGADLLDRALAIERLARARATFDHAARIALGDLLPRPGRTSVVVAPAGPWSRTRFGATAEHVLVLSPGRATLTDRAPSSGSTASYGYPYGEVPVDAPDPVPLPYDAAVLRWRTALAAELCGLVTSGLATTVEHVSARVQFGRPLGTIQTIQQGLTKVHVDLEGCRLMTCAAAATANPALAALGSERAVDTALGAVSTLQQCTGAIGLTREHPLHTWTMRAQALTYELRALRSLEP